MIKNFSTKIPAHQTAAEITGLLATKGAASVQIRYDPGTREPEAVFFSVEIGDREWFYQLPSNWQGVQVVLKATSNNVATKTPGVRMHDSEHARRVAWRIVRDWIDAQLAIIEAGAADLGQVFLPYLMLGPSTTVYDSFKANGLSGLLGAGQPEPADLEVID